MIQSFRHKGLRRLYEDDDSRGLPAEHLINLLNILARLDAADSVDDMNLPGFNLRALKGQLHGFMAVTVRAKWRVIFRVDYLDYHWEVFPMPMKKLAEMRSVEHDDYPQERFFDTELGESWLLRNQHKLNLRLPFNADSRSGTMEGGHDDYAQSAEIADDDIPF
jgi:proteic killer suppression protein